MALLGSQRPYAFCKAYRNKHFGTRIEFLPFSFVLFLLLESQLV
jgi:hypothetical protein